MKKIIYLEACDFESYPMGGTLSFAKQFIENIEYDLYLVGLANQNEPIGTWFKKFINSKTYMYYAIGYTKQVENSVMPKRIITYFLLKKHIKKLNAKWVDVVFTQTPQFVFLISSYKWKKFCFCFAGLGNSVGLSKYKALRIFGGIYEKRLFKTLKRSCDIILAAADKEAIEFKIAKYNMPKKSIISFPTRFNDKIFLPKDKGLIRKTLGFSKQTRIIITTGRLTYIKGWKVLIDSYRIVKSQLSDAILIFVGDGEDRVEIEKYCSQEIKVNEIILMGRKSHSEIASLLNASDVFVMTSLVEGWPTSMVEALACGKNIVSSNISGAKEMIVPNANGKIITERKAINFANAILEVLNFSNPNPVSIELSKRYSASNLNEDFKKLIQ